MKLKCCIERKAFDEFEYGDWHCVVSHCRLSLKQVLGLGISVHLTRRNGVREPDLRNKNARWLGRKIKTDKSIRDSHSAWITEY